MEKVMPTQKIKNKNTYTQEEKIEILKKIFPDKQHLVTFINNGLNSLTPKKLSQFIEYIEETARE